MSKKIESARRKAEVLGVDAKHRWQDATERYTAFSVAESLFERDQSAFASVLGSAIALRLFLFVIPANVAIVGLINLLHLGSTLNHYLESSATTGDVATAMTGTTGWRSLGVFISGSFLTVWAGRSLSRVLATCSGAAWRLEARQAKARLLPMLAMVGVFLAMVVASAVFSRLRDLGGVAVGLVSWSAVFACFSLAMFAAMLTLPRGTTDPGAFLPGALVFGAGFTVLQWFMQFYLPNRIERTTDTLGDLAITVATLGNFFFIGRLMSATFVLNAVLYERFGSVSELFFGLPLVRRIPRRFPKIATFFALDCAPAPAAPPEGALPDEDDTADEPEPPIFPI